MKRFHVQRDQIAAPESEVMLVPEAVACVSAGRLDRCLMNGVVIGLGPFAHQLQRRPVIGAFLAVGRDPCALLQRVGRQFATKPFRHLHTMLVEHGPRPARAVMGHDRGAPGLARPAHEQEMIAVALRAHMLLRHAQGFGAAQEAVGAERLQQIQRDGKASALRPPAGAEMRDGLRGIQAVFRLSRPTDIKKRCRPTEEISATFRTVLGGTGRVGCFTVF